MTLTDTPCSRTCTRHGLSCYYNQGHSEPCRCREKCLILVFHGDGAPRLSSRREENY